MHVIQVTEIKVYTMIWIQRNKEICMIVQIGTVKHTRAYLWYYMLKEMISPNNATLHEILYFSELVCL